MIFAYLGDAPAPAFELPCKDVFEGDDRIVFARSETWDCNWLQLVENSLDAAHVSFVHQKGRIGTFIENVSDAVPTLEFEETDAGIRQIATRGVGNVRVSDWTFPNNNHISVPGLQKDDPWIDIGHWNVPLDDVTTARMNIWAVPRSTPEADRRISDYFEARADYNAADHYRELFYENIFPEDTVMSLTSAQDYLAQRGQGVLADRDNEILGRSDAGIALLRRIFAREMQRLRPVSRQRDGASSNMPRSCRFRWWHREADSTAPRVARPLAAPRADGGRRRAAGRATGVTRDHRDPSAHRSGRELGAK